MLDAIFDFIVDLFGDFIPWRWWLVILLILGICLYLHWR